VYHEVIVNQSKGGDLVSHCFMLCGALVFSSRKIA